MGQAKRSSEQRKRSPGGRLDGQRLLVWLLPGLLSVGGCLGSEVDGPGPGDPDHRSVGTVPQRSPSPPEDLKPCGSGRARGLLPASDWRVEHVYAYQGVEVPLIRNGRPVERRRIDIVQGRDLLVRAFVVPTTPRSTFGRERRAHLLLHTEGAEPTVYEDVRLLRGPSRRDRMESTFNFYVPGEELLGEQALAVELWELGFCSGRAETAPNRVPEEANLPLETRATGPVRVRIVPIRFDADGSGRMPDFSADHLSEFASSLVALFPVSHVEMSVREPVGTSQSDLVDILNQLLQLRSLENPPSDVSYYGIVEPAESMVDYCRFGCVAGVATFGAASGAGAAGVGIGYRGVASETFVHEIGHVYRLMHAPCGGPAGTDPHFPYPNAALGSWGYDARLGELIDPRSDRRDFMSYCDPSWISDYNYRSLIDRLSIVNGTHATARSTDAAGGILGAYDQSSWLGARATWSLHATPFSTRWTRLAEKLAADETSRSAHPNLERLEQPAGEQRNDEGLLDVRAGQSAAEPRVFRTLWLDASGRARWGVPIAAWGDPGERLDAHALDADGVVIAATEVYRQDLSEQQGAFFFVPQPEVGWSALVIEGLAPQPFSLPGEVAAFVP